MGLAVGAVNRIAHGSPTSLLFDVNAVNFGVPCN
jgi:hypothetical protein